RRVCGSKTTTTGSRRKPWKKHWRSRVQLNPPPSAEWQYAAATLLDDPWLARKVDRERRLKEHRAYMERYCAELDGKGLVIDIGPGPGEFLELCRAKGHDILG